MEKVQARDRAGRSLGSTVGPSTSAALTAPLAAWLAACATFGAAGMLAPRFEEAREPESSLRLVPPSTERPAGAAALRLWARVENPNPVGLTVSELAGRLELDDAGVEVDLPLGLPLHARQDTVIPIDFTIGLADVPRLAEVAARALVSRVPVPYRLEGTIAVDAGRLGTPRFGPMTILEGEVRVADRGERVGAALRP